MAACMFWSTHLEGCGQSWVRKMRTMDWWLLWAPWQRGGQSEREERGGGLQRDFGGETVRAAAVGRIASPKMPTS